MTQGDERSKTITRDQCGTGPLDTQPQSAGASCSSVSNPPKTIAIIVTWNSDRYICACLASLRSTSPTTTLLVVDNASSDDTIAKVRDEFPDVMIIESGGNLGYAGGNNIGLRFAKAHDFDYVFIANPDCTFGDGCVSALVAAIESRRDLAVVSPIIFRADRTSVWFAGGDIDFRRGTATHVETIAKTANGTSDVISTQRANGCAMLVRLGAIDLVGLLDERYFLYYEEVDWCVRFARCGFAIGVVASANAFHDVGHGAGGRSESYRYYMTRNRLLFVCQYSGHVLAALPYCLRTSLDYVVDGSRREPRVGIGHLGSVIKGYVDFARGKVGSQAVNFRWWPGRT